MALLKDGTRIYGTLYANTAVITGGINVASQIELAYSQANSAAIGAYTPSDVANSASIYANAAFTQANTADDKGTSAGNYANGAFSKANTADTNASTADGKAVNAGNYANGAFTKANTADVNAINAGNYANAAFATANTLASASIDPWSRIQANLAYDKANTADDKGTSAGNYANGAFAAANTKFPSTGGTISGDVAITGNFSVTGCTTTLTVNTLQVQDNIIDLNYNVVGTPTLDAGVRVIRGSSNPTSLHWNETTDKWQFTNDGSTYANMGSDSGESYANSAFLKANTPSHVANSASIYANAAFALANSGGVDATSASNYANGAFAKANTADTNAATADGKAVNAGNYANAAFAQSNTATTNAATADGKAVNAGAYANSAFEKANTADTNASTADGKAVNAGNYANASFTKANTADTNAIAAGNYANAAFAVANSSSGSPGGSTTQVQFNDAGTFGGNTNLTFDKTSGILSTKQLSVTNSVGDDGGEILLAKPATGTTIAGTGVTIDIYQDKLRFFEQGGTARGFYLDITTGGISASTDLTAGGGGTTDQFARDTANSAGSYANAAFAQANTGGSGTDQFARDNSNASFIKANTADAKATSAGDYANAAFAVANTGGGSTDQFARDTANSAGFYANAAFAQANTGGAGLDAWARIQANLAYNAANSISSLSAANTNVRTYTGDNTTVAYAVTADINANNVLVVTNGLMQRPVTDYTIAAGNLTFTTAPESGEIISIRELTTSIDTTYVASNTSKWAAQVPTTIQVAIDRLANSVYELNANTPISTSIVATAAAMAIALG